MKKTSSNSKNINLTNFYKNYSEYKKEVFENINFKELKKISDLLLVKIKQKKNIFICGNGGSASISNHWECDHREGIKRNKKFKPKAISLISNIDIVSAIANDRGYKNIFAYSLDNLAKKDDLLICFSVSGNSKNIIEALRFSRKKGIKSILFSGFKGGKAKKIANFNLNFSSSNFGVVEDCFQSIMHILAQYLERK